jgi:hypothetical protein
MRIIELCRMVANDIVLSVECGSVAQAAQSIEHLRRLLG